MIVPLVKLNRVARSLGLRVDEVRRMCAASGIKVVSVSMPNGVVSDRIEETDASTLKSQVPRRRPAVSAPTPSAPARTELVRRCHECGSVMSPLERFSTCQQCVDRITAQGSRTGHTHRGTPTVRKYCDRCGLRLSKDAWSTNDLPLCDECEWALEEGQLTAVAVKLEEVMLAAHDPARTSDATVRWLLKLAELGDDPDEQVEEWIEDAYETPDLKTWVQSLDHESILRFVRRGVTASDAFSRK